MSKFQTKEFKSLQKKWYKKLEKEEFKDVEQDEHRLKQWDSFNFSGRYSSDLFVSKEKYYQLVGQFLHEHKFKTKREYAIWEYHSEGLTIRAIAEEIKRRRFKHNKVMTVYYVIQRLEKEMLNKYEQEDD